jgi:hypothetical protein
MDAFIVVCPSFTTSAAAAPFASAETLHGLAHVFGAVSPRAERKRPPPPSAASSVTFVVAIIIVVVVVVIR